MTRPAEHPALGDIALVRSAINLSRFPHPERFHHAGPDPGEQSDLLLEELGYDAAAIRGLRAEGAVS
jgi:crotonobetainyl-CoA:carnitine CoA-transferase CaiB-like acyl-CoA transferase